VESSTERSPGECEQQLSIVGVLATHVAQTGQLLDGELTKIEAKIANSAR
jgi:hypothetical protein